MLIIIYCVALYFLRVAININKISYAEDATSNLHILYGK